MLFKANGSLLILGNLFFLLFQLPVFAGMNRVGRTYYLNANGNNNNPGTRTRPWKSIEKLSNLRLYAGDSVLFAGGQRFAGSITIDSNTAGTNIHPIVIASYGKGSAIIWAGNQTACTVYQSRYIKICRLHFAGAGRNAGNTRDGLIINASRNVLVDSIVVTGFQKAGLLVYQSFDVTLNRVQAKENGFAGISISGNYSRRDCARIRVLHCLAANNPGDPSNLENHSGNGIIAGNCSNILIEYCVATNNGWDMPRMGNGPVGIWCYEADSVIIQHCIAYRNKTARGASDGGGFDLDGGVTNSIIQYCLSYENQGSGYGLFQYAGASNWYNNCIRYCISENDGSVSPAHAGIFIWNSSEDTSQFRNCLIYNNTIYNNKGAAISYERQSSNAGFVFYNNIFVARDSLVLGRETHTVYLGNDWYSLSTGFNNDGFHDFKLWANTRQKERLNGRLTGANFLPPFKKPGKANWIIPEKLSLFNNYKMSFTAAKKGVGIALKQLLGIDNGGKTFNGDRAHARAMGACF